MAIKYWELMASPEHWEPRQAPPFLDACLERILADLRSGPLPVVKAECHA